MTGSGSLGPYLYSLEMIILGKTWIERLRLEPKTEAPPEYYHDLVETLNQTTAVPQNYSDASKVNILGMGAVSS